MAVEKKVNYTEAQITEMSDLYCAAETQDEREAAMDEIAESFGKTIASVRAKLANIGVYVPKAKPAKKGEKRVTKSDLVSQIAENAEMKNDSFFDSLAGANTAVLEYVLTLQDHVKAE